MSCLFDKLLRRGLISGIYPESLEYRTKLKGILSSPATVYTGFDATANSLHVGNLATIINLLHFQQYGHQVICVIGDATTLVGDPSGHTKDRQKIEKSVILDNANFIEETLRRLFTNFKSFFKSSHIQQIDMKEPIFVRNSIWYDNENVIQFVSDMFRHVRVGPLLHKKSIRERLETQNGMNMSEFCYQIFQAYDWMELRKRYDCTLQIGGADQGGNIYTGHDMIKKCLGKTDSIGLLAPLITSSKTGKKLGKSTEKANSSIWLRDGLTSPFDLYQFFQRTTDADVEKFLRVFSFYDDEFIDDILKKYFKNKQDVWYCQRKLAEHACLLVHGEEGLTAAKSKTDALFSSKKTNR